ncbi:unnamed protein product [Caenorhabditis angaria]|uniref:Uncharacterized protein n=1 Tax=Caenorhabditis angaria TaxID=860376 RepID=A0A9P1I759_9PELO|nr:unnamed protein product [Caenorhabditis angaria]
MIHYINERGIVNKLDLESHKILRVVTTSTLLCPVLDCYSMSEHLYTVSSKCISIFSVEKWLDYESYEIDGNKTASLNRGRIIRFAETYLIFFSRKLQICYIWEIDKPKNPSHMLEFSTSEYTVDISCDDENVYSLTSGGVVSIWKLRPNGRKFRDKLFPTLLSNCTQILMAYPQKFVIQTHTSIHFLVFGAATEKSSVN